MVYSDESGELKAACHQLSIVHELPQPGIPKTNAIAERQNSDVLAMTRSSLVAAGLPACFWPYAAPCVCFNDNMREGEYGSAWTLTHKKEFKGKLFAFGCGVWFKPSPTKYTPTKWDGRAMFGIFAGYKINPGYNWSGEYYVWDLDQFLEVCLSSDVSGKVAKNIKPHSTKAVTLGSRGVLFPLKARYDWYNNTIEGREKSWAAGSTPVDNPEPEVTPAAEEHLRWKCLARPPSLKD